MERINLNQRSLPNLFVKPHKKRILSYHKRPLAAPDIAALAAHVRALMEAD